MDVGVLAGENVFQQQNIVLDRASLGMMRLERVVCVFVCVMHS